MKRKPIIMTSVTLVLLVFASYSWSPFDTETPEERAFAATMDSIYAEPAKIPEMETAMAYMQCLMIYAGEYYILMGEHTKVHAPKAPPYTAYRDTREPGGQLTPVEPVPAYKEVVVGGCSALHHFVPTDSTVIRTFVLVFEQQEIKIPIPAGATIKKNNYVALWANEDRSRYSVFHFRGATKTVMARKKYNG